MAKKRARIKSPVTTVAVPSHRGAPYQRQECCPLDGKEENVEGCGPPCRQRGPGFALGAKRKHPHLALAALSDRRWCVTKPRCGWPSRSGSCSARAHPRQTARQSKPRVKRCPLVLRARGESPPLASRLIPRRTKTQLANKVVEIFIGNSIEAARFEV